MLRVTTDKDLVSVSSHSCTFRVQVKQWINGAALHIHTFLHWKRLTNPSSEEVLSLYYLQHVDPLLMIYRDYLHKVVLLSSYNNYGKMIPLQFTVQRSSINLAFYNRPYLGIISIDV